MVSGALLRPNLDDREVRIKLALVLLIGWNGLVATAVHHRLVRGTPGRLLMLAAGFRRPYLRSDGGAQRESSCSTIERRIDWSGRHDRVRVPEHDAPLAVLTPVDRGHP